MAAEKPNAVDIAIARRAIISEIASEDSTLAGNLNFEILEVEKRLQKQSVNAQLRSKAVWVLDVLSRSGDVKKEDANKALEILKSKGTVVPVKAVANGLKVEINQVADYARKEVKDFIEYEKAIRDLPEIKTFSTLQKAVYNLEAINSLTAEGTWLKQYLERRNKMVTVYQTLDNYVIRIFSTALCATIIGLPVAMPLGLLLWDLHVIRLDHGGLFYIGNNEVHTDHLTNQSLQSSWDRGDRWPTAGLGELSRVQAASKILKAVK